MKIFLTILKSCEIHRFVATTEVPTPAARSAPFLRASFRGEDLGVLVIQRTGTKVNISILYVYMYMYIYIYIYVCVEDMILYRKYIEDVISTIYLMISMYIYIYIYIYVNLIGIHACMHACMHAWMHAWMDGWMDGWMIILK